MPWGENIVASALYRKAAAGYSEFAGRHVSNTKRRTEEEEAGAERARVERESNVNERKKKASISQKKNNK